jgi:hypothetical protein
MAKTTNALRREYDAQVERNKARRVTNWGQKIRRRAYGWWDSRGRGTLERNGTLHAGAARLTRREWRLATKLARRRAIYTKQLEARANG